MMLLRKSILSLTLIAATTFSLSALAAIPPGKAGLRTTQQVFNATEEEGEVTSALPLSVAPARPVALAPRQAPGTVPAQRATMTSPQGGAQPTLIAPPVHSLPAMASLPEPTRIPDSGLAYDPVPSDQIDALGRRLLLVETLIRRHGRAYDYRTHTVRDLEMTLAKLDASLVSSRDSR